MIKPRRFAIVWAFSVILFGFVVARLSYLQIVCHTKLAARAERETERMDFEVEPRGEILDRSGRVLAMSIEGGSCYADPQEVRNTAETSRALSAMLNVPAGVIKTRLSEQKKFVWIARRLDPETSQKIINMHLAGIKIVPESKRFYPEETLAAQVLGVVGENQRGLSGVEQMADGWLRGCSIPFLFKTRRLGPPASFHAAGNVPVAPRSLVLSLDRTLQYIAEQELAAQMVISRPKSGTVVIEDPETGEILAMASAPTFDPNLIGTSGARDLSPEVLMNSAVEKVFEPGSTFKLITASAALEQHIFKPTDRFYCENGSWQHDGRTIHDHEKEEWLTFTQVISHSSNIGTAKVSLKVGQENLYRYARAFGFGIPSGCGLPGDGAGILRSIDQWHQGSLLTIAFGQEVAATPLQIVNAYCAIANNGFLMEPRICRGVVDDRGVYREWPVGKPIRRVVSAGTAETVRRILRDVVENGTGKAASVQGVIVGGKTGTAQKIDPRTRQYSPDKYMASFCGMAPLDHPRIVVGIFLDEPSRAQWGGSEAAPVFARIVRAAASYLHFDADVVPPAVVLKASPGRIHT
jgi:cell division protein FtsI (penicillin-binding protein 3)